MKRHYNDYELLYLIHTEHDDYALEIMFDKYEGMIWKNIHMLCYEQREKDDFYQEARLVLYKAIQRFKDINHKTFTRFFELILKRKFYDLNKKQNRYLLQETLDFMDQYASYDCYDEISEQETPKLNPDMQYIYEHYFLQKTSIQALCLKLGWTRKKVYNAIYNIKQKYKNMV